MPKLKTKEIAMVLKKMSVMGDEVVKEWNGKVTDEQLADIEREFNHYVSNGWLAANLATNELIHTFNKDVDMLLIPRIVGG